MKKLMKRINSGWKKFIWPSLHGIVMCMIILASFCWAWFSVSIDGVSIKIKAATYDAEISVSGNGSDGYEPVSKNAWLENGQRYDICIKAVGTAVKNGGYCIVSAGDMVYHTAPLTPESELKFTITLPGSGSRKVDFLPVWGSYREEISAGIELKNGDEITGGDSTMMDKAALLKAEDVSPGEAENMKVKEISGNY